MPRSLLTIEPSTSSSLKYQPSLPTKSASQENAKRIVHIGLGAFARAHIAVFTQLANFHAKESWRISGVVRSNQSLKETLALQGQKYTVYEITETPQGQLIDCIDEVLNWQQESAAIINRLSSANTKLVTVTVTEKGYYLNHDGRLDLSNTEIATDIERHAQGPKTANSFPATLPGLLCEAFSHRMKSGLSQFTVISCDNVSKNGDSLKTVLLDFAEQVDPNLRDWIEQNLHSPNTVVDCIVPKVTTLQIEKVQSELDIDDNAPVLCEPFRQWVLESGKLADAPPWELAGAEWVENITPFEEQKLRILNAAHSALAYWGLLNDCIYICDTMVNPIVRTQLNQLMETVFLSFSDQEAARRYFLKVVERFENPAMQHALTQIGSDGSAKIPLRWFPSINYNAEQRNDNSAFSQAIAAWIACWHLLPTDKLEGMSDPKAKGIKQLGIAIEALRRSEQFWQSILGFQPPACMQNEIENEFRALVITSRALNS